jgi:predicted permease
MRRLLLKLVRRRRLERDLADEIAFHRQMAAAGGNTVPFGNQSLVAEQARDLWRFSLVENLWRDVAYGIRSLVRSPALVVAAILSIGLGIGANTTVFSLAVELLLSQPSVADPASIVYVRVRGNSHASRETVDALRASGLFVDVAGENEESYLNWNDGGDTRRLFGVVTTKNFFRTLGVPVAIGRGFAPDDPDEVVVLAHHFWRRLGGDPAVLGQAINLDGRPHTIVGVLRESHRTLIGYGVSPDVYAPAAALPRDKSPALAMYARLAPGMSLAQARRALAARAAATGQDPPLPFKYADVRLAPIAGFARLGEQEEARVVGFFFLALLAIVTLVLLIACVNVAGLLLARATTRRREMAIRLALGASRRRLLQQLLVESLLLSVAGAVAGVVLALFIASALSAITLPIPIPVRLHIEPEWRAFAYAGCLAALSTVACGLIPAWQSARAPIAADLPRERKRRLRSSLVACQIGVSFVVLTAAVLFARNLVRARTIDPGFDIHRTVRAGVYLPPRLYADAADVRRFADRTVEALEALPGVEAAAVSRVVPFNDSMTRGYEMTILSSGTKRHVMAHWNVVTPDYFSALGIPIRQGRAFRATDDGRRKVLIVNRTYVERFLDGQPAVGLNIAGFAPTGDPYEIVGVVEPTKNVTIGEQDEPQVYEPFAQVRSDRVGLHVVVRSAMPPAGQVKAVHDTLRAIEPGAGLEVRTMSDSIGLAFLPSQVGAALMGGVGALGLLLVAVGLSGTMAYSVSQRTREIGLRLAIGATRGDVARLVAVDSARIVAAGAAAGGLLAWLVTKPLAAFLVPGLSPTDPTSFALVAAVIMLTGVVATWVPARRAASVDPMMSLRQE